jgi:hypothetical protein
VVYLREHLAALRECDQAFETERDRRYAEVNVEREKALKIKETADLAALQLAREIQTYKDEKANQLREQISSERSLYVTREELASAVRELQATIKPLTSRADRGDGSNVRASSLRSGQRIDIANILQAVMMIGAIITLLLVAFHH